MTLMSGSFRGLAWNWMCTVAMTILTGPACAQTLSLDKIKLPPGFAMLVAHVDNARAMTWGTKGTLFVGSMRAGKVYALRFAGNGPPKSYTIASNPQLPAGVAFRDGALYVSAHGS